MRGKFNSARSRCGGGQGRGGDVFLGACRRRRRRGGLGMRTAPKALNFRASRDEFNSALTLRRRARARGRFVPRRVSATAKARRPAALPTPGRLGRYWAAQWHSARAVGKRFRGCRAKRLYVHLSHTTQSTTDNRTSLPRDSKGAAHSNAFWRVVRCVLEKTKRKAKSENIALQYRATILELAGILGVHFPPTRRHDDRPGGSSVRPVF